MTLQEQVKSLTDKIIANLCRITERPEGWLPHIVYVEEEGDYPIYNRYELIDYAPDGSCTLYNPRTDSRENGFYLNEINIDWLITVWNRYIGFCIGRNTWKNRAVEILQKETTADEMTIRKFIEEKWQIMLLDEDNINAFKQETDINENSTQLYAFHWSCHHMNRNISDEEIIEAWENGPSRSKTNDKDNELYEVEKLTPDELVERINNECFSYSEDYVRFIKIEE